MPIPASDLQNHLKGHNLLIKFLQNRTQEEEGYNCISKVCLKIIKNWLGERIHYACLNESKKILLLPRFIGIQLDGIILIQDIWFL